MACYPARSTISCTHTKRTCNCTSANDRAFVVRQPVRHSSWQNRRQTVRPRYLKAARQQQGAAEREAQALPRVHQPKGQLNNALPKAKRRPPADAREEVGGAAEAAVEQFDSSKAVDQNVAAATAARREPEQQLATVTSSSSSLVAAASESDQSAAAPSGQRAASGTVLGAIALITGKKPLLKVTFQHCMPIMCWDTVDYCTR